MRMLFFALLVGSMLVSLGGYMTYVNGQEVLEGCQAVNWPHTTATILSLHRPDFTVRYAYTVDGREFKGTTIHPAFKGFINEQARLDLERVLTPGKEVRVYYRADAPDQCTLAVGFFSWSLSQVMGGLIFMGIGLGFPLMQWLSFAGNNNYASGITEVF